MGNVCSQDRSTAADCSLIVALSGLPGVGKSTLGKALAEYWDGALLSFGEYVRSLARERNAPLDRATLQAIGNDEVTNHARAFVVAALATVDPTRSVIVIDGVRHAVVLDHLQALGAERKAKVRLVHLELADESRLNRLAARGVGRGAARAETTHASEQDVQYVLPARADMVLNADQPLKMLVAQIAPLNQQH
jgi:dephospho-CoA kinase